MRILKNLVSYLATVAMWCISLTCLRILPFFYFLALLEKSVFLAVGATVFAWFMVWTFRVSRALLWIRMHMLYERRDKVSPEEDLLIVRAARIPWPLHRFNSPDPPRHY